MSKRRYCKWVRMGDRLYCPSPVQFLDKPQLLSIWVYQQGAYWRIGLMNLATHTRIYAEVRSHSRQSLKYAKRLAIQAMQDIKILRAIGLE